MDNVENAEELDRSREGVIKAWFDYNAETGDITWKSWVNPAWYKKEGYYVRFMEERAGKPVEFNKHPDGHLRVSAGGTKGIYAHHIAWVLTHGKMPNNYIDHIDGDPENNRVENLRDVHHKINLRNQKMSSRNTSGVTGVSLDKRVNKWRAMVKFAGIYWSLGYYDTIEQAAEAREGFLAENEQLGYTKRHGKPNINTNGNQEESK